MKFNETNGATITNKMNPMTQGLRPIRHMHSNKTTNTISFSGGKKHRLKPIEEENINFT